MAELSQMPTASPRLVRGQMAAILWLRWRILLNSSRRKGGAGELFGRLLLLPFLLILTLGPALAAAVATGYCLRHASFSYLPYIFWAAFVLSQLYNLNLGQPGTTFDPTELIRFPLSLPWYVLVRLCFGVLSAGNLAVVLTSVGILVGAVWALPPLWPYALWATFSFALASVLFSRMIFAWVDRWLSTRRAREVFTGLIFAGSLVFQYFNLNYNPGFQHGSHRGRALTHLGATHRFAWVPAPLLHALPPELAARSLQQAALGKTNVALLLPLAICLYAVAFLAIYARRMRTEYRGENLSDAANAVRRLPPVKARHPASGFFPSGASSHAEPASRRGWLPATLWPLLQKEVLLLRRNVGLLYGVIAPTVMVFLFAGRLSWQGNSHGLLLLGVAYALLGLAPMSYNSLGLEGTGAQFYFMAPVPMREVLFAKNLLQFGLALFDVAAILTILALIAGRPHFSDVLFVLFWALMTLLLNASVGNLRTLAAPKKVAAGRGLNRTQSQLSMWIAIGILAGCTVVGGAIQLAAWYLHLPWMGLGVVALLAAAALFVYYQGLRGIDAYALKHRETLLEELGKKV